MVTNNTSEYSHAATSTHDVRGSGLSVANDSPLLVLITEVERDHFRTVEDSGANLNVLLIWNIVRRHAGLPRISRDDLPAWDGNRYTMPAGSRLLANLSSP